MAGGPQLPFAERMLAKIEKREPAECWEWCGSKDSSGYGVIRLSSSRRMVKAHRATFELSIGPIPEGLCVMHTCDNPPCCNPAHLRLGSHADNMADMAAKGRATGAGQRGEKSPHAKLTEGLVREIRRSAEHFSQAQLGVLYGVSQTNVGAILRRKTWIHVS